MRVFVTGASGFVGSAVVQDLLAAGHEVVGLARSDQAAAAVEAAGATVHRGSLEAPESLAAAAVQADGVVHTAFNHDFSRFAQNGQDERAAIAAIGEALAGSGKPLVVASGVALLTPGRLATEDDRREDDGALPRAPEAPLDDLARRGVRATAIRLSPTTHGRGDHGFVARLIGIARETGVSAYVGEGANHWPAVHRLDAARLFRLALEKGEAGARYHAVAEEGVPMTEIAAAIGRGLGLPVVSKPQAQAAEHFGWFAMFAGIDCLASSALTRERLGWIPSGPALLEDLQTGGYFDA